MDGSGKRNIADIHADARTLAAIPGRAQRPLVEEVSSKNTDPWAQFGSQYVEPTCRSRCAGGGRLRFQSHHFELSGFLLDVGHLRKPFLATGRLEQQGSG